MDREQRAEALMRQGPIQNVRRIMELEDAMQGAQPLALFPDRPAILVVEEPEDDQ